VYRHQLLIFNLVVAYLTSLCLYLTSVGILRNLMLFFNVVYGKTLRMYRAVAWGGRLDKWIRSDVAGSARDLTSIAGNYLEELSVATIVCVPSEMPTGRHPSTSETKHYCLRQRVRPLSNFRNMTWRR
jgi:hypothetical protein